MTPIRTAIYPIRALAVLLLSLAQAYAQPNAASVFTVANVRAEAEAADSLEAKRQATRSAEMRAWRLLLSRLTDFRARQQIPDLPAEEVERIIAGIDISGEGVSGTSYVANFGVSFSERAVLALFARYGAVPILDRGPEILIVPVYVEDGAARTGDRNPWRSALLNLDLAHALVPAKVAPVRNDITAAMANAYIASPAASIETLKAQYRTTQIVFAVANLGGGEEVALKLIGNDAAGPFSVERNVKSREAAEETSIQAAARVAFETVQQRWKLTRDSYVQAGNAGGGAAPASGGPNYTAGAISSVVVTAQYSGLKEWQAIRARLQNIPGIQNWDLRSVNPRSAEIAFDFPGGAERLGAMAAGQGLSIENGPDGVVVRTR